MITWSGPSITHQRSAQGRAKQRKRYIDRYGREPTAVKRFTVRQNFSNVKIKPVVIGKGLSLSNSDKNSLKHVVGACEICGYSRFPEALIIHHRDRNRLNNKPDNLAVLCRNCHFLVHHRGGFEQYLTNAQ